MAEAYRSRTYLRPLDRTPDLKSGRHTGDDTLPEKQNDAGIKFFRLWQSNQSGCSSTLLRRVSEILDHDLVASRRLGRIEHVIRRRQQTGRTGTAPAAPKLSVTTPVAPK